MTLLKCGNLSADPTVTLRKGHNGVAGGVKGQAQMDHTHHSWRQLVWYSLLIGGLLALLTACSGMDQTPTTLPATSTVPPIMPTVATRTGSATPTMTRTAAPPAATVTKEARVYPTGVLQAQAALASELHMPTDEVTILRYEAHNWPDTALGCPQPGRAYLQVVTPGYRVWLQASGHEYEYHTDEMKLVVRCTP